MRFPISLVLLPLGRPHPVILKHTETPFTHKIMSFLMAMVMALASLYSSTEE